MCDAGKELKEVVQELLKQMNKDHNGYTDRANRMFSVRELTVPLLYVIPLMASIFVGAMTFNTYINKLETSIERNYNEIKNELTTLKDDLQSTKDDAAVRSYDRITRTDFIQICYNWQLKNPSVSLDCNSIYNINSNRDFIRNTIPRRPQGGSN